MTDPPWTGLINKEGVVLTMFEPFIGCWEASDGSSRQELAWGLNRQVVRTLMWFRDDDKWKLVSEGAFYRDPGSDRVVGFASAIDMPVTHFDILAQGSGDGLAFTNVAYAPDDTPLRSTEQWRSDAANRFTWQLFRDGDDMEPIPWMDGEWKRLS